MKNLKKEIKKSNFRYWFSFFSTVAICIAAGLIFMTLITALESNKYLAKELEQKQARACYDGCVKYNDQLEAMINDNPPVTDYALLRCAVECNK